MKAKYLQFKKSTYCYRRYIPERYRQHYENEIQFYFSLKTSDEFEAIILARQKIEKINKEFKKIDSGYSVRAPAELHLSKTNCPI